MRGRRKLFAGKSRMLNIRFGEAELAELEEAARSKYMPTGTLVRWLALEAVRRQRKFEEAESPNGGGKIVKGVKKGKGGNLAEA
jgi:hypothetical protein